MLYDVCFYDWPGLVDVIYIFMTCSGAYLGVVQYGIYNVLFTRLIGAGTGILTAGKKVHNSHVLLFRVIQSQ